MKSNHKNFSKWALALVLRALARQPGNTYSWIVNYLFYITILFDGHRLAFLTKKGNFLLNGLFEGKQHLRCIFFGYS